MKGRDMAVVGYIKSCGAMLIACVGFWGAWTASRWPAEDGLYPMAVFGGAALFAVIVAAAEFRQGRREATKPATAGDVYRGPARKQVFQLVLLTLLTAAYVLTWDAFGYVMVTVVYTFVTLFALDVRNIVVLIATPLGVTAFVQLVFAELLGIPFP